VTADVEYWDQINTFDEDGPVAHIVPVDDFVEHTVETACVCGPAASMCQGTLVVAHWALDGTRYDSVQKEVTAQSEGD
jgi:hypothetical protein